MLVGGFCYQFGNVTLQRCSKINKLYTKAASLRQEHLRLFDDTKEPLMLPTLKKDREAQQEERVGNF